MSFRGSRHLRAERGTVLLERAGARKADAMTTEDYTSYYALVPARALPLALWVESERMAFTLECFDDRILDLERSLIEEEEAVTGVNTWFPRTAVRRFFGAKHPYYVHSGELVGDLDAVRLTDAQWFYQRAYRPDNARLILVGDFDPARADEWVRRYFGSIVNPSELFSRPTPPKVAAASVSRLAVEASVNREALRVLWPAPPPGTREQLAMILLHASSSIVCAVS